jgi:hypothetical protein
MGRLRGERRKVERVSYGQKRQRERWLTGLTKGLEGMCIAHDWTHVQK